MAEGIFDVFGVFNATNEYVLYYHSGRKTIRAFTRKNGDLIATFRVQADLKGMETTTDGRSIKVIIFTVSSIIMFRCVVLGMGDGSMTTLTIADPEKEEINEYLKDLPSRNPDGKSRKKKSGHFIQNNHIYPSPYDYSIYTDYLRELKKCIPEDKDVNRAEE